MVKLLHWKIVSLFCLLYLSSCAVPLRNSTPAPVSNFTEQDLEVATKQAHQTLNVLLKAMIAPEPSYDYLGLKVRFRMPDGGTDDNWTEPVDYYNGIFTIRMVDGLTFDHNQHPGHTLDIPLRNVVDWMIVEKNGNLIGGYTIRLTYEHLTRDQQKEFLKVTGYIIK